MIGSIVRVVIFLSFLFSIPLIYASEERDTTKRSSPVVEEDGDTSRQVAFNFVDVELPVLAKFVSDICGKNFIFDERLKGKITIIAPSKLNLDEAYKLFISVLEFKGFTLIHSGLNAYKIILSAEAKQKGMDVLTEGIPQTESYIVRLIQLQHISSEEALNFLRPIVSRDGYLSTFKSGNLLLVIDSALNIEKILNIIENIDMPSTLETPEIVFLKYAPAEDVARVLNEGMKSLSSKQVVGRAPLVQMAIAVADTRLNAVVLFGSKSDRESIKRLIAMLDVPSPADQGRINVYFLENADAEELAKVLDGIVKGIVTSKEKPVAGRKQVRPFESMGRIIITPDKATNSLLIVASPSDYNNLVQVIERLDKRCRQVYVEAMIVEASIDRLKALGAKWRAIGRHSGAPVIIGGVGILDAAALQSIVSGLTGFTTGGMGDFFDIPITTVNEDGTTSTSTLTVPGFAALFSLEEFKDAVNVLSTPQILTSDNKEAEIVVGENVPFITKRESDPTRTVSVFSTIERKDVGITLRLTPQITEGDYVKLDIYQEISSVKQEVNTDIIISVGPTTTKRSTNTSVVVKDKQTMVVGGLMQEKKEEVTNKVPLLGDIPLLGWFFKSRSTTKKKTNLLVFLTPHIVRDAETMDRITDEKKREFSGSVNKDDVMSSTDIESEMLNTAEGNNSMSPPYIKGQLLLRFKNDVIEDDAKEIIYDHGAKVIEYLKTLDIYLIELRNGETVEETVHFFNALQEVEYAEPNYTIRIQ